MTDSAAAGETSSWSEAASNVWGWDDAEWGWAFVPDDATVHLVEQLAAEFQPRADLETVTAIVLQARRELDVAERPAGQQAVEELARRRLHQASAAYSITAVAETGPGAGSSADVTVQFLAR